MDLLEPQIPAQSIQNNSPAGVVIQKFKMEYYPLEGGWMEPDPEPNVAHGESPELILQPQSKVKDLSSSVKYLLKGREFSCWHKIIDMEEHWTFLRGTNLVLHQITNQGHYSQRLIGNTMEDPRTLYTHKVPASCWMAAELETPYRLPQPGTPEHNGSDARENYTLINLVVVPSFSYENVVYGSLLDMLELFPHLEEPVRRFCRQ